jgi:hypothetical protein
MTQATRGLELTGAGFALADAAAVVAAEPACAWFERDSVLTGPAARARARLAPLFASTRYLEEPGTEPLARQRPIVRNTADLVYAQLAALARLPVLAGQPVVLAVSSGYSLEQLRLLVGIATAAELTVTGLVNAAVAAAADRPSLPRALHLDLEMHRAVLTELIRADGLRRGRVDLARAVGLRAIEDALAQHVAQSFVRATRFDPLHQAVTEQALYDRLPDWLAAAAGGGTVAVLEHGGLRHETRLEAAHLSAALAPLTAEILRLVHSARRAGEALTLYLTERVSTVPGLLAALGTLHGVALVGLPSAAAAAGALAHAAEIEGPELAFVSRLAAAAAATAVSASSERRTVGEAPTHVVCQGRVWALGSEPLVVGRMPGGPRAIAVSGSLAGVSRTHCVLIAGGGDAVLEDLSSYGTFVNGERVERRARLAVGDRIRVGTPGVELELVRIAG